MAKKMMISQMLARLAKEYPDPPVGLDYQNPWQLLVATMLAAQCTDEVINQITPALFSKYPMPANLAKADLGAVENLVRRSGFFRAKARNIQAAAKRVVEEFGGKVPETLEELVTFPGVARKTANVVMSHAFGRSVGIVVDTHVLRVCFRMGLSREKTADKMEADLMGAIPQEGWKLFPNRIKVLGQQVCKGKKPLCEICPLKDICPRLEYKKGK